MKTEKPILFSGPMVRAILDGRKTQTRRVVKPQPSSVDEATKTLVPYKGSAAFLLENLKCPYGKPGDGLWVRETTCIAPKRWATPDDTCRTDYDGDKRYVAYRADGQSEDAMRDYKLNWTPSIHVPRWASRIDLEITGLRVERLQDISEADAIAEGVTKIREGCHVIKGFDYDLAGLCHSEAVTPFAKLWDSINGIPKPNQPDVSWEANPWVWVIEFKRVEGRAA